MALKKPNDDMYSFVNWIWNPISGRCLHNCSYCYVKRIAKRFNYEQADPHFVEAELRTNLGHGNTIFVCSGCDLFASDIPYSWIKKVIDYAHGFDGNQYIFQTKNPKRFITSYFGLSVEQDILCTTIETDQYLPEIMGNSSSPFVRAIDLSVMREYGFRTMVTIEPIMDFTLEYMLFMLKKIKPEQVNIGADSGNNRLPEPPAERIRELITSLKTFTHVVEKNNLRRIVA